MSNLSKFWHVKINCFLVALFLTILSVSHIACAQSVTASSHDGNIPENTLDNNLNTRWSARGNGQWITYDLGQSKIVDDLDIAFYKGNERRTTIDIQVSSDNSR